MKPRVYKKNGSWIVEHYRPEDRINKQYRFVVWQFALETAILIANIWQNNQDKECE